MDLEAYLNIFTNHVEVIIQWVFFLILGLVSLVLARSLFSRREQHTPFVAPTTHSFQPEIQNTLQQLLEKTAKLEEASLNISKVVATSPPAYSANANDVSALIHNELDSLKKELKTKEEELYKLKSTPATTTNSADSDQLSGRIKELEAKLAEYEILEDDIADLSLYKDENSRLKQELDKLKSNPAKPSSDIVAEFAQVVNQEPLVSNPTDITEQVPQTGDPMTDFEAVVQFEKKSGAPTKVREANSSEEANDLFAEFSQEQTADLDTDKMMAEMAALVNVDGSTSSLDDDTIDTEKMAQEAGNDHKQ